MPVSHGRIAPRSGKGAATEEFTRRRCRLLQTSAFALVLSVAFPSLHSSAQVEGEEIELAQARDMLIAWAARLDSQFDRIETWEGTFEYTETERRETSRPNQQNNQPPDVKVCERKGKGNFAVDARNDALFVEHTAEGTVSPAAKPANANETVQTLTEKTDFAALLTDEHYVSIDRDVYHPQPQEEGVASTLDRRIRLVYRDAATSAHPCAVCGNLVDPARTFMYFEPPPGGVLNSAAAAFDAVVLGEKKDDIGGHRHTLTRLGEKDGVKQFLLKLPNQEAGEPLTLLELVIEVGTTVQIRDYKYTNSEGRILHEVHVEYESKKGIDVPVRYTRSLYTETGEIRHSRDMTIQTAKLNAPIDSKRFTVKALGISEGDRLVDKVDDVEYVFSGGEFVEGARVYLGKEAVP